VRQPVSRIAAGSAEASVEPLLDDRARDAVLPDVVGVLGVEQLTVEPNGVKSAARVDVD
jgi:hypothetical protein